MSDNTQTLDLRAIGTRIRECRKKRGMANLEQFADRLHDAGCKRPSVAKLSRIEAGVQPVTTDILTELSGIIGIPPQDLRPDLEAQLVALFPKSGAAA